MVAVLAATLLGGALTAYLLVPRDGPGTDGSAAGLQVAAVVTPPATATPPAPTTGPEPTSSLPVRTATAGPAEPAAAAPTRVVLGRLGIDMAVQPEGVDGNGQMALPGTPQVAGWYAYGRAPADDEGAVVLAAHVDSHADGVGPFVRLGEARAGDEVAVWVGSEKVVYRVSQVARVDKARLDADGVFAMSGAPRLHLVTCTGAYTAGSGYQQNLVVVADRLTGSPEPRG